MTHESLPDRILSYTITAVDQKGMFCFKKKSMFQSSFLAKPYSPKSCFPEWILRQRYMTPNDHLNIYIKYMETQTQCDDIPIHSTNKINVSRLVDCYV